MTLPPPFRFTSSTLSEIRRISLEPDSLLVEARDFLGAYRPETQVFWDEVRAVYVWEAPNWQTVIVGILLAFLAMLLAAGMTSGSAQVAGAVAAGVAVLALFLFLAVRLRPSRWYRLDTDVGPVTFTTRRRDVLEQILSRLRSA